MKDWTQNRKLLWAYQLVRTYWITATSLACLGIVVWYLWAITNQGL